ncbi:hypothetical protein UL63_17375, partial [Shigella dysenteriae]
VLKKRTNGSVRYCQYTSPCPVCFTIWQDVHRFTHVDFDTQSGKSDFIDTCHSEIITGHVSITGKK